MIENWIVGSYMTVLVVNVLWMLKYLFEFYRLKYFELNLGLLHPGESIIFCSLLFFFGLDSRIYIEIAIVMNMGVAYCYKVYFKNKHKTFSDSSYMRYQINAFALICLAYLTQNWRSISVALIVSSILVCLYKTIYNDFMMYVQVNKVLISSKTVSNWRIQLCENLLMQSFLLIQAISPIIIALKLVVA